MMVLSGFLPSYALSAEATVKKFYDNVSSKRCFDAVKLRPAYSLDSCENIDKIYVHKIKVVAEGSYNAVILVELDVEINDKNTYFLGHTLVKKNNKKWLIEGPYKSKTRFSVDEYIAEFIPQGLHAEGEQKKSASQVVVTKKTASSHQLPPGDAVDASATLAVTSPQAQSMPLAPAMVSKDAKEEQQKIPKKQQQLTQIGTKPLQNNKEMDSYFLGNIPIQGNFMGLVENIQALLPELAQQVILIDKSQSILYLYKEKNVLAGFFPVLTASIADFPSGLYQIGEQENETASKNKTVVNESSITMKKLELSAEQQILMSGYYYLRNYFDKDQKQSLALSPIDNNKLQQLIVSETLVYIAE